MRRLLFLSLFACGTPSLPDEVPAIAEAESTLARDPTTAPFPQREGDPERGYDALINSSYLSCGVPTSLYEVASVLTPSLFFGVKDDATLPGRRGLNEGLPYFVSRFETKKGVDLTTFNCLTCHASRINGELVIGLGNNAIDFTRSVSTLIELGTAVAAPLYSQDTRDEMWRFEERLGTAFRYFETESKGVVPGDVFGTLAAHRDRETLEWLGEPDPAVMPASPPFPIDIPPWWRVSKKNAVYYLGYGRADHARLVMMAAMYCTDSVEEARALDQSFVDIIAFVKSLKAPKYPKPIDTTLADQGRAVYGETCARCHGTPDAYANKRIPVSVVGTDSTLADFAATPQFDGFVKWMQGSYYGELMADTLGRDGYVAPPLDGVWATAPYLHNGSVPTLATLLDSSTRPQRWTRNFDENTLNEDEVGVVYKKPHVLTARKNIYDTRTKGYGNGGHTFGDALSAGDRSAVIEYLKTL